MPDKSRLGERDTSNMAIITRQVSLLKAEGAEREREKEGNIRIKHSKTLSGIH